VTKTPSWLLSARAGIAMLELAVTYMQQGYIERALWALPIAQGDLLYAQRWIENDGPPVWPCPQGLTG